MANIGDFDAVLLKIWQRLSASRGDQNPFVELAFLLVLSGGAYHVTRKMVKDRSRRVSDRKKSSVVRAATSDIDSDGDEDLFSSSSSDSDTDSDDDEEDYGRQQYVPFVAPQGGFNPAQYMMAVPQQPVTYQPPQSQPQWTSPYPQHTPYGYVQQQQHTPVPSRPQTPVVHAHSAPATPAPARRRSPPPPPSPRRQEPVDEDADDELLGTPSPMVNISRTASVMDEELSEPEHVAIQAAELEPEPEPEPETKSATPGRSKKSRSTKRKKKRSSSRRAGSDEQQ
jgi:hypothetical protein